MDQIKRAQRSASGGGECAAGGALAKWVSRGNVGKSTRLTRQTGAGTAAASFAVGADVTGCVAVSAEMTQQFIAVQQPSENDAGRESGCEQQRCAAALIGACRMAAQSDSNRASLPNMLNF